MPAPSAQTIAAIRHFSRFYTRAIGALHEGLLGCPLSLTEGRIVYEIATCPQITATDLGRDLRLDAGYLSRTLKALETRHVITRTTSADDARQSLLNLTPLGRQLYVAIDAASQREVGALVAGLTPTQQMILVEATAEVERLLGGSLQDSETGTADVTLRAPRSGDYGWVIHRHAALYATEYGWDQSFEALVAKVVADYIEKFDAHSDCGFIADRGGDILGSAFVVRKDDTTAKLRLVYVEQSARGIGLGRRLVEACMQFAQTAGYARMSLWTNDILVPARRLYEQLGFVMTAAEPHHSFGHDLIGETWERDL